MHDPIPPIPPRGPKAHKEMARLLGIRHNSAQELIVLEANNDPFYKGTPAHVRDAEWFAGLWDQFGYDREIHLRRVHYQVLSKELFLPDGRPYLNTERCWHSLCSAGAAARILGLVDVEAFRDARNPAVQPFRRLRNGNDREVGVEVDQPEWRIPTFDPEMFADVALEIPAPQAKGYGYHEDDQPVLLELWVEKSTMNDVLIPECERVGANFVAGIGFESITQSVAFLRRAEAHGVPAHIVYVSDFDPAGEGMPVAVARQVQFWMEQLEIDAEVSVDHAVLGRDLCDQYDLPRSPIKVGDKRASGFELRHGAGATELDALEALHPGVLAETVRHAMEPFVDRGLPRRLAQAGRDAQTAIDAAWAEAAGDLEEEATRLSEEASSVAAEHAEEIAQLVAERLSDLDVFSERAAELQRQAQEIADGLDVELPARPEPTYDGVDDARLLFDTRRHWLEQLRVFKARQGAASDHD